MIQIPINSRFYKVSMKSFVSLLDYTHLSLKLTLTLLLALPITAQPPSVDAGCALSLERSRPFAVSASLGSIYLALMEPTSPLVFARGDKIHVVDPLDAAHAVQLSPKVGLPQRLVLTRERIIGLDGNGEFFAQARGIAESFQSDPSSGSLDALDALTTAKGDTWVVAARHRLGKSEILTGRILGEARPLTLHQLATRASDIVSVRLAQTATGALAIAWIERSPASEASPTYSLWLQWLSADRQPSKLARRLDVFTGAESVADLALAAAKDGIIIAWNPLYASSPGTNVELRVFYAEPGRDPVLWRRIGLRAAQESPSGSLNQVVSNQLQAAALQRDAILAWVEYPSVDKAVVRATLAASGDLITLLEAPHNEKRQELPGWLRLRAAAPSEAVVIWVGRKRINARDAAFFAFRQLQLRARCGNLTKHSSN